MNRATRRASRNGRKPPPLCRPGAHSFQRLAATVGGAETAVRVVCTACRRTIQQVMEESPADLAMYREWLAAELAAARAQHVRACPRRFELAAAPSDGCAGCTREAQLAAEDREVGQP